MIETVVAPTKVCSLCQVAKPWSEFHRQPRNRKDGLQGRCKRCALAVAKAIYDRDPSAKIAASRQWRRDNPSKARRGAHRAKLRSRGLTFDDYDRMLAEQGYVCAICGTDTPGRKRTFFCVDHDHATGQVRGLLCMNCNDGLGRFGDTVQLLGRAIAYLGGRPVTVITGSAGTGASTSFGGSF